MKKGWKAWMPAYIKQQNLISILTKKSRNNWLSKMHDDSEVVQNEMEERRSRPLIRQMKYHKVGCLKGLKRDKEADALVKELWQECIEKNDSNLLEDLRMDGYDFEE